ncbi:MAG: MFS transporter [Anaerolineae bacterium]|nr:MFS transporter [Anaerolineae bacterium]
MTIAHQLPASEVKSPQLSFVRKLAYGVGDVGPALVATISGFFLNVFLLDVAGLEPYLAAIIFLIVKVWDSLNDPIIGTLTDRTNTRWGRRRPWLLFGAIPFGLAWFLQWLVPDLGTAWLFIYYLVVALLLDTSLTCVNVPYTALTPEIAPEYDERTSLNTFRFSFSILGGMFALLLHDTILKSFPDITTGYMVSAALLGAVIIVTNWITFAATKETHQKAEDEDEPGFVEGFKIAFGNRAFLMVTGIYLLSWLAIQFIQANMLFYVRYWMNAEDNFIILAMSLQISIFVSLIFWAKVSGRIGKRHAYFCGVGFWILIEIFIFFVQPGQMLLLTVLAVLAGAGAGVAYLIPWSMLPDVVDVDELNTGLRREGVYYGFFVFLQKLGISLGLAISNLVLQVVRYVPAVPGEPFPVQNDTVLLSFRLFISFAPLVILLLSLPVAYKYPITRQRHAEIRAELAARKGTA